MVAQGVGPRDPRDSAGPRISLAQWSLHRSIERGELRGLEFPRYAASHFDIHAVELVNVLLEDHDEATLRALRRQADDAGVKILLVMIDDEGDLSAPSAAERRAAVERHARWLEAAAMLGCHSVRVNTGGGPEVEEDAPLTAPAVAGCIDRCAESCRALCELAAAYTHAGAGPSGLGVLLENHGGLSSNIDAVVRLQELVGKDNFGTLPDFGNFSPRADTYDAVAKLMPFAGAVSAKCFDFDEHGEETVIDYPRMLKIVRRSGYRGCLGIEYEGERLSEPEGVRACKRLLERLWNPESDPETES